MRFAMFLFKRAHVATCCNILSTFLSFIRLFYVKEVNPLWTSSPPAVELQCPGQQLAGERGREGIIYHDIRPCDVSCYEAMYCNIYIYIYIYICMYMYIYIYIHIYIYIYRERGRERERERETCPLLLSPSPRALLLGYQAVELLQAPPEGSADPGLASVAGPSPRRS